MDPRDTVQSVARREFLIGSAALASAATVSSASAEQAPAKPSKTVGIQVGAVSFVDEGRGA
jgi:hypothetical protein